MRTNMEVDEKLARRLDVLKNQPRRNPEKTVLARAAYLDQAQELANSFDPAVTEPQKRRHIGWMHPLQLFFGFQKKEHSPMFATLGTVLLIVALVLGGSGATVAAAQNSLPDEALYPVKTWSEDVQTGLTSRTQSRLQLALAYVNRRAEEMQVMLRAGKIPPEAVQTRMQSEIDRALRLAAGQPDNEAVRSLEQIRQQLQAHEQAFMNLEPGAGAQVKAVLEQTRIMLQERLHECDQGIHDPELLREHLRDRDRLHDGTGSNADKPSGGAKNPWTTGTPTPGSGYGPGHGDGTGSNPWTTGTPTPGSGYGPGPGDGMEEPGEHNPWTSDVPTPGSSYGPGPGDGTGDSGGEHNGPGEPGDGGPAGGEHDGPGEPGGNESPGDGSGSGGSPDHNEDGSGSPDSGGADQGSGSAGGDGSGSGGSDAGSGGGTGGSGGKP